MAKHRKRIAGIGLIVILIICFFWPPATYFVKDLSGFGCQQPLSSQEGKELLRYLLTEESTKKILPLAVPLEYGETVEVSDVETGQTGERGLSGEISKNGDAVYFSYTIFSDEAIITYLDGEPRHITVYKQNEDCLYVKTDTEMYKWTHFRHGRHLPWE